MSCWIAHWMDAGRPSPMIMTPLQRRSACHSVGGIKTLSLYRMYYIYIFIWCLYICVLICIRAAYICRMYTDYRAARAYGHAFANQHREIPYVSICILMYPCANMCVYYCILAALLAEISIYWIHDNPRRTWRRPWKRPPRGPRVFLWKPSAPRRGSCLPVQKGLGKLQEYQRQLSNE